MSQNKIFSEIINQLISKYSIDQKLIPTYRFIENDKYLYIIIRLIRNTDYNPYQNDIYFSITLNDKFPESLPIVKCLTNFSYPNLYDNSDLYKNIILFRITDNIIKKEDPFLILEDIILGLKPFLEEIKKNEEKNKFVYYGDYILDEIYDINDFFSSQKNEFFRANQIMKENKIKKYIILNDVYFLLFDPVPDVFNYAKLIFFCDIMILNNINENNNEKKIYLEIKDEKNNKNDNIKLCFEFDQKFNEFLKGKNDRINKLKNKYKLTISKNDINEINEAGDIDDYNTKGFQISKSFVSEL
jgi:ubiquitin-protein ligase